MQVQQLHRAWSCVYQILYLNISVRYTCLLGHTRQAVVCACICSVLVSWICVADDLLFAAVTAFMTSLRVEIVFDFDLKMTGSYQSVYLYLAESKHDRQSNFFFQVKAVVSITCKPLAFIIILCFFLQIFQVYIDFA